MELAKIKMKKLEYRTGKKTIRVYVADKLWAVWPRNLTTVAIARGKICTPADLNAALCD